MPQTRRLPITLVDLVSQGLLIQIDPESRPRRQIDVAILDDIGLLQIPFAQRHVLLRQEVWDARIELQARSQRDRPERTVRRHGGEVGLAHRRNLLTLEDAAGVREIRLQHSSRLLLQDLPETPFGEETLAGGNRNRRAAGDGRQRIDVLRQHRLLDKHRAVRLQRPSHPHRHRRADPPMEIDPHIHLVAHRFADHRETLDVGLDDGGRVHDVHRAENPHLQRRKPLIRAHLGALDIVAVGLAAQPAVHSDAIPCGAAQQLIDRHPQPFSSDVPQRLLDARDGAAQHRTAAVELPPIDRLPVVLDAPWILPDQIATDLLDRRRHRLRASFDHRLAQAHDALISMHLQEEPARLHKQRLQPRDFHVASPPSRVYPPRRLLTTVGGRVIMRGIGSWVFDVRCWMFDVGCFIVVQA